MRNVAQNVQHTPLDRLICHFKLDKLDPLLLLLTASFLDPRFRKLESLTAEVGAYTAMHVRRSAAHKTCG